MPQVEGRPRRQCFVIRGRFPSFNDWQRICKNPRHRSAMKRKHDDMVADAATEQGIVPMEGPVRYSCIWYEANMRRDLDNVAFAKKFIQDGLVQAGIIPDDSPRHVVGFSDDFALDRDDPRVEITLEEICPS